ncbi:hypothetical protein EDEG_02345 [Edhazardia aedis USNM 41457]|uniref:Uncharacterized protein n=1 Tax=Edhazardia aedis (strain USNM 41457) TaxID=1003232 RepID=J9D6Y0_EDHAE|nr:hypothetical protein EDEG_02345 [Edhazardia aedis USNM 41457]|eukprot:EJW03279.1 hypothetical protein EDEG_02345 [Edhazardia aedis USNM 41457]
MIVFIRIEHINYHLNFYFNFFFIQSKEFLIEINKKNIVKLVEIYLVKKNILLYHTRDITKYPIKICGFLLHTSILKTLKYRIKISTYNNLFMCIVFWKFYLDYKFCIKYFLR